MRNRNGNVRVPAQDRPAAETARGWLSCRTSLLVAAALTLTGCSVGPHYMKPELKANESWSTRGSAQFTEQPAADSAWWRTFNDPTLEKLIQLAFSQNPRLHATGARILEARAVLGIAVGRRYPQLQEAFASATGVSLSENVANNSTFDRDFWDFQVGFDVAWEADFWNKDRQDREGAAGRRDELGGRLPERARLVERRGRPELFRRSHLRSAHRAGPKERRGPGRSVAHRRCPLPQWRHVGTGRVPGADALREHARVHSAARGQPDPGEERAVDAARSTDGRARRPVAGAGGDPGAAGTGGGERSRGDVTAPSGHPERRARGDVAIGADRRGEGGAVPAPRALRHGRAPGDHRRVEFPQPVQSRQPVLRRRSRASTGHSSITAAWRTRCGSRMRAFSSCCSTIRTPCSRRDRKWRMAPWASSKRRKPPLPRKMP